MTPPDARRMEALARQYPGTITLAPLVLWRRRALIFGFLVAFLAAAQALGLSPGVFFTGLSDLGIIAGQMWPPTSKGFFLDYLYALGETVAIAFLGTIAASVISVPLGFLGARNVVRNGVIHFGLRRVLDVVRGVDVLIWALIFVSVVGLGPFAGILAIALNDIGVLAKLYAEGVENADRRAGDGVRAGDLAAGVSGVSVQQPVFLRGQHPLGHHSGRGRRRGDRLLPDRPHPRECLERCGFHHPDDPAHGRGD